MSAPDESTTGSERPCGISTFIPLGMSCRGRAEAFARRLQSRLRTLGSQGSVGDGSNGADGDHAESTWLTQTDAQVTSLQPPLRTNLSQDAAADSFFDFDMEPESPESPIDECEYSRLIETTTHTPHPTDLAPESGYVCASPISVEGSLASQSSSDGPYFDPESSDAEQRSLATDYHDCIGSYKREGLIATIFENVHNGALKMHSSGEPGPVNTTKVPAMAAPTSVLVVVEAPLTNGLHAGVSDNDDADSCSDSLPPSQSTTTPATTTTSSSNGSDNAADKSESTVTGLSSQSNSTLLDETEAELGQVEDEDGEEVRIDHEGDAVVESQLMVNKDELVAEGLQQNNTSGLVETVPLVDRSKILNGQCNGYAVHHHHHLDEGGMEKELPQANGHLPQEYTLIDTDEPQLDEVDHCRVATNHQDNLEEDNLSEEEAKSRREQQMQMRTERIILECLNIIDATPEASPEPEGRGTEADPTGAEGQLKVHDGLDTEVECEADERPQRVRRCSSLKTGKTPPGTPGRKKIVRFADVLGLDLAAVRTFMDEMPKIPKSAFEDLDLPPPSEVNVSLGPRVDKVLVPLFQQPGSLAGFLDVVRDHQVSLENAAVTDPVTMTISGSVRVRNLDFHKSVYVRYSTDAWRSFSDLQANYVENSCDGFSDKFTFVIFGNALQVGERIELAVRFHCKGQILWDNNYGTNYCFQCLPVSTPVRPPVAAPPVDAWHGASFY